MVIERETFSFYLPLSSIGSERRPIVVWYYISLLPCLSLSEGAFVSYAVLYAVWFSCDGDYFYNMRCRFPTVFFFLTWSNHVRTLLCHFLWKWPLGTTLLCLTILLRAALHKDPGHWAPYPPTAQPSKFTFKGLPIQGTCSIYPRFIRIVIAIQNRGGNKIPKSHENVPGLSHHCTPQRAEPCEVEVVVYFNRYHWCRKLTQSFWITSWKLKRQWRKPTAPWVSNAVLAHILLPFPMFLSWR